MFLEIAESNIFGIEYRVTIINNIKHKIKLHNLKG